MTQPPQGPSPAPARGAAAPGQGAAQGPHVLPSLPRTASLSRPEAAPYEPVCAIFRRYLHGQKLKFTPERAMMLDAVLRKDGLFDPEQLVDDLKQLGHRVSRATVYRTLAHLQDAGILKQVFFDNRRSYYEVIAGRQAYDYLICVATGKVIEFASEKLRKLRDEICREHGFDPLSHQFHVFGLSPEGKVQRQASGGGGQAGAGTGTAGPRGRASPFSRPAPAGSPFATGAPGKARGTRPPISRGPRTSPA